MGDLFTLPQDVDTQVSPLYRRKVSGRQAKQYNMEEQLLNEVRNSYIPPTQTQQQQPSQQTSIQEQSLGFGGHVGQTVKGLVTAPYNAAAEMALTLKSLQNWASEKVYNATDGAFDLGYTDVKAARKDVKVDVQGTPAKLVQGLGEFATGFFAGGTLMKGATAVTKAPALLKLAESSTKTATGVKGAVKVLFSDATAIDPHQDRFSNLLNQFGAAGIPVAGLVTSYLAADPNDSELEGRFKNALEGLGIGVAAEGLFLAAKLIKARYAAKGEVKSVFDDALRAANKAVDETKAPFTDLTNPSAVRQAKQADVFQRLREQERFGSSIDQAEKAAAAEEQRLIGYERGDQALIEYKPNFTMVDNPEIALPKGGIYLGEDLSHLAVHDYPRPPEVPRAGTIDAILQDGIGYKPKEVSGKIVEGAGEFPVISEGRRIARSIPDGQFGDIIPYAKSLGHDSLDSFLDSLKKFSDNNKGFVAQDLIHSTAGGGAGALVGGKVDINRDGQVDWEDIATGFVLGAGMTYGMKRISQLKAEGKTEAQALKEVSAERVAELDAVISKIKGSLNSGTLDDKAAIELQDHLKILEELKGKVSKVKAGTVSQVIKKNGGEELSVKYTNGTKPFVTFKEDSVKLDELIEAINKGDSVSIAKGIDINFEHIQSEDDIKNLINLVTDKMHTGKSGVRTEEMVRQFADELGFNEDALKTLVQAEKDTANLDSKLLAMRGVTLRSAEELKLRAEALKANPADDSLIIALRKQALLHTGIQRSLSNVKSEVARAMKSMQYLPTDFTDVKGLENAIASLGGKAKNVEMADHILSLMKDGNIKGANQYARAIDANPKLNALMEFFINSLLSSPKTWGTNILSNSLTTVLTPTERLLAGVIRGGQGTEFKQAQAMMVGMSEGIMDAWRMAKKSWEAGGEGILDPLKKIEGVHYEAISSGAFDIDSAGVLGRAIDAFGSIVRFPGKVLGAGDEFFKVINSRMALNEQLYLKAISDAQMQGLTGDALAKASSEAMAALKNDVPVSIMEKLKLVDKDMKDAVIDMARYNTFTTSLSPANQGMAKWINSHPFVKFFVPFFKVPVNILKYSAERTPVLNLLSKDFRANMVSKDPAVRADALAKLSIGSMVCGTASLLYSQGLITGRNVPITEGKDASSNELAGKPAYSVKIGDTWYSYNRLDPIGMMLGLTADTVDILSHNDEATSAKVSTAVGVAIAKNLTSKTYLQGISNLIDALNNPSPDKLSRIAGGFLGTVIPAGINDLNKAIDPTMREAQDLVDYIYKRTPGLSKDLPPVRNIFGEAVTLKPGYGMDSMSPIYSSKETDDPVKQEFMRLGISQRHTMNDMKKVHGEKLTPEQKDRYIQLMGEPLKKSLDKIIASSRYERASEGVLVDGEPVPGGKEYIISQEITKWKSKARMQLFKEYPDLKASVLERQRIKKEAKKDNSNFLENLMGG